MSVLQHFIYPAALTLVGIVGNAYVLGNQVQEVKDDVKGIQKEIKSMKVDIRGLLLSQKELEAQDMAMVQKLVMDCSNKK